MMMALFVLLPRKRRWQNHHFVEGIVVPTTRPFSSSRVVVVDWFDEDDNGKHFAH
jgi:hypothetical protein